MEQNFIIIILLVVWVGKGFQNLILFFVGM